MPTTKESKVKRLFIVSGSMLVSFFWGGWSSEGETGETGIDLGRDERERHLLSENGGGRRTDKG
ncbi:hypothetical protein ACFL5H_04245 [Candidatus Latescibacterota bacterium]